MKKLPAQQLEYQLVVLNGADRGTVYRLVAKQVTIGRGTECDIVISNDPKVSRQHAELRVIDGQVEITDISDRNKILVDGDDSPRQTLRHNAVIQLGETKLQFKLSSLSANAQPSAVAPNRRSLPKRSRRPSSYSSLILGLFILLGAAYYLNSSDSEQKTASVSNPAALDPTREPASPEQELAELRAKRIKIEQDPRYTEAQEHFVKGRRDYNNAQYERASESFKACLALKPDHSECQQYFNDSERARAQLINEQMILGLRAMNQNQYSECIAAFKTVMVMVKTTTDQRYQEAQTNMRLCEEKRGQRF